MDDADNLIPNYLRFVQGVFAMPIWVAFMGLCYWLKPKRVEQASAEVYSPAK
jgi:hypothetical protein